MTRKQKNIKLDEDILEWLNNLPEGETKEDITNRALRIIKENDFGNDPELNNLKKDLIRAQIRKAGIDADHRVYDLKRKKEFDPIRDKILEREQERKDFETALKVYNARMREYNAIPLQNRLQYGNFPPTMPKLLDTTNVVEIDNVTGESGTVIGKGVTFHCCRCESAECAQADADENLTDLKDWAWNHYAEKHGTNPPQDWVNQIKNAKLPPQWWGDKP